MRRLDDGIMWLGNVNGNFTVKEFCEVVETKILGAGVWLGTKKIQKILPTKVNLFFWQAVHNRIAVKANLLSRGMTLGDNGICSGCGKTVETTNHAFLGCEKSIVLWYAIMAREGLSWVCPGDLQTLMEEWAQCRRISDTTLWDLIPYSLCYSMWLERNASIFQNVQQGSETAWDMHKLRIAWWITAWWGACPYGVRDFVQNFVSITIKKEVNRPRLSEWNPPPLGMLKFNVDGSARGSPGISGVGGVLRDASSTVMGFFSMNTGISFAYEAEIKAILQALIFCQQFSCQEIIIEGDSMLAIGWVNNKQNRPVKMLPELNRIDRLLLGVNCVAVIHAYREANTEADRLAKEGCDQTSPIWVML